jgi:hypothetical protein
VRWHAKSRISTPNSFQVPVAQENEEGFQNHFPDKSARDIWSIDSVIARGKQATKQWLQPYRIRLHNSDLSIKHGSSGARGRLSQWLRP